VDVDFSFLPSFLGSGEGDMDKNLTIFTTGGQGLGDFDEHRV
jgi:hypothetical protein